MKLTGSEASRYCARPDPARAGLLIFGADTMRVALKRAEAVAALIGPDGPNEMRLTRISAADLRKDAARLGDTLRETGFFAGPRVVFVEDATDGLAETLAAALRDWQAGDANLVVTAGNLTGKSALKTLFEKAPNAVCIGLYDDPPTRDEILSELARAGLTQISPPAMEDLTSLARALDPGDFRQLLEKIALFKHLDPSPLSPAEVADLAPMTIETEVEDLLAVVAGRDVHAIGPLLRRLEGQGILPVTLCIGALRHFRALHLVATDKGGISNGLLRAKVFGPRRDAMARQAGQWGGARLEEVIRLLLDTDLALRSSARAPSMAVMERALMRIAMMKA